MILLFFVGGALVWGVGLMLMFVALALYTLPRAL
jgi:hypothetical protein